MADFVDVQPGKLAVSAFEFFRQGLLIAAEKDGKANAMTAAWGGMGTMWYKDAVFAVLRPQRYTREFLDGSDTFSVNVFDASRKDLLEYFGTVSGRDEDKIGKAGLTLRHASGAPYFDEAGTVVLCRKLYAQPFAGEFIIDGEVDGKCYPNKDYHILYIGEVLRIMSRS